MRKNLLLLLLFPLIALGFGSLVTKKIDTIEAPSGTLTLKNTIVIDSATVDSVSYVNSSKELTSSSISQIELEHLEGVTQNIQDAFETFKVDIQDNTDLIGTTSQDLQTNIDTKVSLTGSETVAGDKTFSGETVFSNTGSISISKGTTLERPAGTAGLFRYNSDDDTFEGYTTEWGPIAGGGDLNEVTQSIIPDTDISYDIGTLLLRWKDIFTENISTKIITASQSVTPATPASGNLLYFKADDNLYKLNSAGTEQQVGALLDLSAVTQDIIPDTDITYDLGTAALKFDNAWIETVTLNEVQSDGKIEVTSTTQSSIPCPVMTRAEMEAIATPTNGSCVFNSTDNAQYNYDLVLTQWVIAGSVINVENISDWIDDGTITITSTGTAPTKGTVSYDNIKYRRVGDSMEVSMSFRRSGGTQGSGIYLFEVPSGLQIDSSKIQFGPGSSNVINAGTRIGTGEMRHDSSFGAHTSVYAYDATRVYMVIGAGVDAGGGSSHPYTGDLYGTPVGIYSGGFTANYTVPVVGWESSTKYASTTCEGLKCFNEFSARIVNNGTCSITSESLDFLASCNRDSLGSVTVTFNTGLFTVIPSVNATVANASVGKGINTSSISTTSFIVQTSDDAVAAYDQDFDIIVQRQGADFFDHDERFIPISDQRYSVNLGLNDGRTITANTEDIHFSGSGNGWTSSGDSHYYTVQADSSIISISFGVYPTGTNTAAINLYKDGVRQRSLTRSVSSRAKTGDYISIEGEFSAGDQLSLRTDTTFSLSSNIYDHYLNIVETLPPKAYVGNLNPKTLVETTGSNKPKMYSAAISEVGVVSNQIGTFINGNCTNSHPSICTMVTGAFTSTPNCQVGNAGPNDYYCHGYATSLTSITVFCNDDGGGNSTTVVPKILTCHGE